PSSKDAEPMQLANIDQEEIADSKWDILVPLAKALRAPTAYLVTLCNSAFDPRARRIGLDAGDTNRRNGGGRCGGGDSHPAGPKNFPAIFGRDVGSKKLTYANLILTYAYSSFYASASKPKQVLQCSPRR